jgi:hypothetical protein
VRNFLSHQSQVLHLGHLGHLVLDRMLMGRMLMGRMLNLVLVRRIHRLVLPVLPVLRMD